MKPIVGNQAKSNYSLVANYSINACSISTKQGVWNGISKSRPIDMTLECWPTKTNRAGDRIVEPTEASEVDE